MFAITQNKQFMNIMLTMLISPINYGFHCCEFEARSWRDVLKFGNDWTGQWFSLGTPVSSTNKTDRPDYNWNIIESSIKHSNPESSMKTRACVELLFKYADYK